MDLTDFEKSLSEMTEDELLATVTRSRRERKTSGKRAAVKKKAVKKKASGKKKTEDLIASMTDEQKKMLRDKLLKSMGREG